MSKRDWRLIIVAFGILAVLWCIGGFVAAQQYSVLGDHTDQLAADQRQLNANTRRLKELTASVTGALCLAEFAPDVPLASEPDNRKSFVESDLARDYVTGRPQPLDRFGPVCPQAVQKARKQLGLP